MSQPSRAYLNNKADINKNIVLLKELIKTLRAGNQPGNFKFKKTEIYKLYAESKMFDVVTANESTDWQPYLKSSTRLPFHGKMQNSLGNSGLDSSLTVLVGAYQDTCERFRACNEVPGTAKVTLAAMHHQALTCVSQLMAIHVMLKMSAEVSPPSEN